MKKTTFIAVSFFISISNISAFDKQIKTEKEIRGPYKNSGNYIFYEYDTENRLSKKTIHDDNARYFDSYLQNVYHEFYYDYKYDSQGRVIKEEQYFPGTKQPQEYNIWSYDHDGKLIQKANYNQWNKMVEAYKWEYDENNYKVKEIYFDSLKNKWILSKSWEYSDNYCSIKETEYKGGVVFTTHEYKYDSNSNLIQEKMYDKDGKKTADRSYEYDANNNQTKAISFYSGNVNSYYLYEYDSKNNLIKEIYCPSEDSVKERLLATYEYDGNNRKTKEANYLPDGSEDIFNSVHFEYDENGNLAGKWKTDSYTGLKKYTELHIYTYY